MYFNQQNNNELQSFESIFLTLNTSFRAINTDIGMCLFPEWEMLKQNFYHNNIPTKEILIKIILVLRQRCAENIIEYGNQSEFGNYYTVFINKLSQTYSKLADLEGNLKKEKIGDSIVMSMCMYIDQLQKRKIAQWLLEQKRNEQMKQAKAAAINLFIQNKDALIQEYQQNFEIFNKMIENVMNNEKLNNTQIFKKSSLYLEWKAAQEIDWNTVSRENFLYLLDCVCDTLNELGVYINEKYAPSCLISLKEKIITQIDLVRDPFENAYTEDVFFDAFKEAQKNKYK